LVFVTDLKPAGRRALERLQRLFAEHRIEAVGAPRLGGMQVATALIVDPQGAARTGAWANTTRALALGGEAAAAAVRCFPPVGAANGVSVRLQIMRPQLDAMGAGGEVRFLAQCPPQGPAPLAVGFGAGGLEVRTDHTEIAVEAAALEAGRWYDVVVALQPDGTAVLSIDGKVTAATARPASGSQALRIAGIELRAPAGGRTFVDDIAILPGVAAADDGRWGLARRRDSAEVFGEDFETTPYGLLAAGVEWRSIDGTVSALASPKGGAQAAAAPATAANAFDGGHGSAPGEFDQPVGIALDPGGNLFVADKANHRIEQFARDGSFVRAWGEPGNQPGQFREPHDVAADAEFVYVADTWNQRVQVFDRDGAHVFSITGDPSMASPRGVFAKDKLIYVAQAGDGRVNVYDRAGALRRSIGTPGGDGPGHLIEPVDVAVDAQGDVWVVNAGNNRIEHFAADGTPRAAIPIPGWTGNRLKEVSLAIDADGTLYLSDWDVGGVRRFRPDGSELAPLGSGIRQPSGIALEPTRVLVAARAEDVIRVYPLNAAPAR
jgi:DNA-binding beta-propeller fold protein YncE